MLVTLHLSRDNDCDEFMYGLPEHFHSFNMEEYVVLFSMIFKKLIIIIIISFLCFWDLYSLVHINYNGSVTFYIVICYHVLVYFIPLLKNSAKQLSYMLCYYFFSSQSLLTYCSKDPACPHCSYLSHEWHPYYDNQWPLLSPHHVLPMASDTADQSLLELFFFHLTSSISYSQPVVPSQIPLSCH